MKSILPVKKFLGLVEMMSGLVNASFSLPKWQAVKMIFFAPYFLIKNDIVDLKLIIPGLLNTVFYSAFQILLQDNEILLQLDFHQHYHQQS